jgi:hypothetical protein
MDLLEESLKKKLKKLTLAKETLVNLQPEQLLGVGGGDGDGDEHEPFPTSWRSFLSFCGTRCFSICHVEEQP